MWKDYCGWTTQYCLLFCSCYWHRNADDLFLDRWWSCKHPQGTVIASTGRENQFYYFVDAHNLFLSYDVKCVSDAREEHNHHHDQPLSDFA